MGDDTNGKTNDGTPRNVRKKNSHHCAQDTQGGQCQRRAPPHTEGTVFCATSSESKKKKKMLTDRPPPKRSQKAHTF